MYLAAEFDWEVVNPKTLEQAINITSIGWDKKPNPHYLAKFDVKLTLTKRHVLVPWDGAQSKKTPEGILMDSAYQPEKYTLTLEKGAFPTPCVANIPTQYPFTCKYAFRLTFDKSPYPSLDKWVSAYQEMVSHDGVSEWTQFVSRDMGPWNISRWENCSVI